MAGCSSDRPKPTPLETYTPRIAGRVVWQASIGSIDRLRTLARGFQLDTMAHLIQSALAEADPTAPPPAPVPDAPADA